MSVTFKYIRKVDELNDDVLNCAKVELWDFSKSNICEEARIETITTVASLSYGNQYAKNPEKLYKLLIDLGHESVFEFIRGFGNQNLRNTNLPYFDREWHIIAHKKLYATFKISCPIFVARQVMRHRSFSYLEVSRRYTDLKKVPFHVYGLGRLFGTIYEKIIKILYKYLTFKGYQKQHARTILPVGSFTTFWMQGDCYSFLNFFIERLSPAAQPETRILSELMLKLLLKHQPEFIEQMMFLLKHKWIRENNSIFRKARIKKAEDFVKIVQTCKNYD